MEANIKDDERKSLPPYLTARQAAELLGVNVKTVYAAIKRREIESVRVGRTLRIPRDEIATFEGGRAR